MKTQFEITNLENRINDSAIEKAIDQLHQHLIDYEQSKMVTKNNYLAYETLRETRQQLAQLKNKLTDLINQSRTWETD